MHIVTYLNTIILRPVKLGLQLFFSRKSYSRKPKVRSKKRHSCPSFRMLAQKKSSKVVCSNANAIGEVSQRKKNIRGETSPPIFVARFFLNISLILLTLSRQIFFRDDFKHLGECSIQNYIAYFYCFKFTTQRRISTLSYVHVAACISPYSLFRLSYIKQLRIVFQNGTLKHIAFKKNLIFFSVTDDIN